jgi:chemotaxis regulatin CheY-phosphate phosphatase CheZ
MKQEAKTPKKTTKKRITIKKTKNNVENALNTLEKMKEKEDDLLEQSDFLKNQYLAWFDTRNDTPRRNKYKEIKKQN